ncbi:sulfotransferase [Catellatospora sp. KI3]|uniref:sulfotransferase family protein n=1 Tax=Catellatospora sp. KI3 TaxID=3041620 RepID=UPI002482A581|nr:sulfotransferase [Catellatospora sp. KI3]MDI1463337.1 sulfotransferase [Catellatospora sp. KI3]
MLKRPVFLMSTPRAGSTLLFEVLAQSPRAWTIGGESHAVIEAIEPLRARERGWESSRLTAEDATPQVVARLGTGFQQLWHDRDGRRPGPLDQPTLLEKTPRNALRLPFLAAAFPDARFVYLYREPAETISSMLEGWLTGRCITYPDLPGWTGLPWSFMLVPGWRELIGRPVAEIAAVQWATTTEILLNDLARLDPRQWLATDYRRLVADPAAETARICSFLGWPYDRQLTGRLPLSAWTISAPHPDKWRRNADVLEPVLPLTERAAALARSVLN